MYDKPCKSRDDMVQWRKSKGGIAVSYLWPALFAAAAVAVDQFTKHLTVTHIAQGQTVPVLDGVVHLTYVQNTGAAFSMLTGKTWLFFVVTAVFFAFAALAIVKKWLTKPLQIWSLAAICGGAVGNLIDRVAHAYVVDMIAVDFIDFPVFNFADCCITVGAVLLVLIVLFERKSS